MENKSSQQPAHNDDIISLSEVVGIILGGKWWIASAAAVFMVLSLVYLRLATPVYRADALIQVESNKSPLGSLVEMDMSDTFTGDSSAATEIEILRSRFILGQVVKSEKLNIVARPKYFPVIGEAVARRFRPDYNNNELFNSPLFGMGSFAWGGEAINVERFTVPVEGQKYTLTALKDNSYALDLNGELVLKGTVGESAVSRDQQVRLFVSRLNARPGTRFELTRQPVVNAIGSLSGRLSASERGRQTGILTLAMTGPDVQANNRHLNAIANQYLRQNIERVSAEAQNSLDFLENQLPEIQAQLKASESRLNRFQQENQTVDLPLETKAVLDQVVNIESQLAQLELQIQQMGKRYTHSHPLMVELLQQKSYLEGMRNKFVNQTAHLPTTQQEVMRLSRDVEVNTVVYTELLNKAQELRIVRASAVGNVRILDSAMSAIAPVKPKKRLVFVLATLLGGMLGTGIVFIREIMRQGVKKPEEIESRTGLPVYATVAESEQMHVLERNARKQGKGFVLADVAPADLSVEALRSLRTNLAFALMEAENNRIMITGPASGVGKSFVSTNLAMLLSENNQRVLLIDADMRKGNINRSIGQARENGLAEIIAGKLEPEAAIHSFNADLDVMTCGYYPPNPSELLMTPAFKELLEKVSAEYDAVIVDTPPILAVTDPVIVGKLCATNFMVVRAHRNPIREVQYACSRFELSGIHIKGCVLNGMIRSSFRYGYY